MSASHDPSRPAVLDVPAADLCLAFANTRYWRGSAAPTEDLKAPSDLLGWCGAHGVPADAIARAVCAACSHPVTATIRIQPGGRAARTTSDGTFELEVAPGRYTVSVEAPGFQAQSRQLQLYPGQVTIYNVDLRRDP